MDRKTMAIVGGIAAAIVVWFAENAFIHALGYSGFVGGFIGGLLLPVFCGIAAFNTIDGA